MKITNPFGILAATADMKAGNVYLANEGAVDNRFLSEPLTQFSVGWTSQDGALERILNILCGAPVTVSKLFQWKKMNNKDAFYSVENDEDVRAIGSDFKRIEYGGTTVDAHTVSKGLTLRIDNEERNANPQAEQEAVAYLRTLLMRGECIRAFNGLSGAATNTAKTWGTGDNKADADNDVMTMLNGCADDSGLLPNTVYFGPTAKQKRFLTLRAAGQSSEVASGSLLTNEQLAGLYGVKTVDVCNERFQYGANKATLLATNLVLAFNAQQSGIKNDPSNIKRFVTKVGGSDFAVFREEHAACVDITVSHQSLIAITSNLGIGKLTIS